MKENLAKWHTRMEQVKIFTADDMTWDTEEIFSEDEAKTFQWGRKYMVPPPPSLSRSHVDACLPCLSSKPSISASSQSLLPNV